MAINKDELTLLSPPALISLSISVSPSSSFSLLFIDPLLYTSAPSSPMPPFPRTLSLISPLMPRVRSLPPSLPSVKSSCLPSIPLTSSFFFNFSPPDTAVHHALASGRRPSSDALIHQDFEKLKSLSPLLHWPLPLIALSITPGGRSIRALPLCSLSPPLLCPDFIFFSLQWISFTCGSLQLGLV